MPKKSPGRKRGIQRCTPRHLIGSKTEHGGLEGGENETGDVGFLSLRQSKLLSCGQKCFEIIFSTCEKLHLIGFTRTSSGEYVLLDQRRKCFHYAAMTWYLAVCLQKALGTMQLLFYEELRIETFMCVSLTGMQINSALVSLGVLVRPKETVDLLNSWFYLPAELDQVDFQTKFQPLDDISACLKVIGIFFVAQGATAAAAVLSIIMSNLPICLFPLADRLGLVPDGILSRFAWQLLFAPLEWFMYLPPLTMTAFSSSVLFMGTGALSIYLEPLRFLCVNSLRSHQRLERLFVQLELFNRVFQVWIRFCFPTWLLGYACATVVALFVTIRYTELPVIFYIFAPYVGLSLVSMVFWQSYDMIHGSRGSEDILGVLLQTKAPYWKDKTMKDRAELMKRSRAMRPLSFPVADCEFSWSLPVNTWEEILNQLVFLLSL